MNRSWSFWVILGLALPLAAACGTSSSTKNNTPPATSGGSLPAYTLVSESPVDCATENTDGSVTADINCHVHLVFNDAVTTTKVRMNITGTFQASEVYPLLFGSNSAASDGWVLEFFRSGAAPNGMLYMYVTPGESASPQDFHTFSNIFNQGDAFSLTVEADRGSSPDTILAWADTTPTATPAGDYNSGTSTGVPLYFGDTHVNPPSIPPPLRHPGGRSLPQ